MTDASLTAFRLIGKPITFSRTSTEGKFINYQPGVTYRLVGFFHRYEDHPEWWITDGDDHWAICADLALQDLVTPLPIN
jgi:hypothetical protein